MNNWNLTESEMFPFFEMTPDLVCIAGRDGFFKKVNRAVIEKFQYPVEELYANPISSFMHPEDKENTLVQRAELLNGKVLVNLENRYLTKNNEVIWLNWTSVYLSDKEIVFAIAKDITQRKKQEQESEEKYRKFKNLTSQFKSNIEKDRRYLAYEMHEQLAQLASVIKIDIEWMVENNTFTQTGALERMGHVLQASKTLINTIRRLSFSFSPAMLEDIGLSETLEWLCKDFSMLQGITCHFKSSFEENQLSHEMKLDFFRICQDALNNVSQHAAAKMVDISLMTGANKVYLIIKDDGKGFEGEAVFKKSGLNNIYDRVASLNGQINIQSSIGKGTIIQIEVDML